MSHTYPDPSVDSLPELDRIAPAYERLRRLAAERLDGLLSVEIDAWEDGEFRLRASHSYAPVPPGSDHLKAVLQLHSVTPEVRGALFKVGADKTDEGVLFQTGIMALADFPNGPPTEW
jgi:hypothetical protein